MGVLIGVLPLVAVANVGVFTPDPVGEKAYRAHLSTETVLPIAVIVCALLAAWVAHKISRQTKLPESSE
jgi:hypothetical protein